MGKRNDYIKYTCCGYKYAPESFRAYKVLVDRSGCGKHKYVQMDLTAEQRSAIGNSYICKGRKAASDLAKRYDRKMMKEQQLLITYGFLDAINPSHYHFTQQLHCKPNAPLKERHAIFKKFREYLMDDDSYVVTTHQLDAGFAPVSAPKKLKRPGRNADLSKPVVVYLKAG